MQGDIYNHSRLVQEIHAVDVVIRAAGGDQNRIIAAIKEGDNIIKLNGRIGEVRARLEGLDQTQCQPSMSSFSDSSMTRSVASFESEITQN
ncbi:hypothetical protein FCM35_KLT19397 [Carex littledalei]|uniref:Uncharacterized protein n=1 Tax=Carex littledalei TaxID=544730 RepID=A0A833RCQ4_9POAL|nr:hypothetical protein FCM35_KLT19397 [Carex littledalei]